MAVPAEVLDGTGPGRCPEPGAQRRIGEALERRRKTAGIGRIIEQAFEPVANDMREPLDSRHDDRKPRRHVLEDLERRPVELARKRRMRRQIERRDAHICSGQTCRNTRMRKRACKDDAWRRRRLRRALAAAPGHRR